jgi:hypothetical protein
MKEAFVSNWMEDWMDSSVGLEERGERNIITPAGDQTQVIQPIAIHYTDVNIQADSTFNVIIYNIILLA